MLTQITKKNPELIPLWKIAQIEGFSTALHELELELSDDDTTAFIDGETIDFILEEYSNRAAMIYTDAPGTELLDNLERYWSLKQDQYTAAWLAYTTEYDPLYNYDLHETGSGSGSRINTGTQTIADTGTQSVSGNDSKNNTGTQTISDTGNTTTNTVSAFDSATYSPHDKSESSGTTGNTRTDNTQAQRTDNLQSQRTDNLQSQRTDNLSESGSHSETRTDNLQSQRTDNLSEATTDSHSLRRYGNIGVTSSQQLLESELQLRLRHSLQERFIFEFVSAFTV